MRKSSVEVSVTLTHEEATALAVFLRRAGYSDFRESADSKEQAYLMLHATARLRDALAESAVE